MAESNDMLGQGCGCYIQAHGTWITYCPMHKAAPEMLAALEALYDEDTERKNNLAWDALGQAHGQARGQEVGA